MIATIWSNLRDPESVGISLISHVLAELQHF